MLNKLKQLHIAFALLIFTGSFSAHLEAIAQKNAVFEMDDQDVRRPVLKEKNTLLWFYEGHQKHPVIEIAGDKGVCENLQDLAKGECKIKVGAAPGLYTYLFCEDFVSSAKSCTGKKIFVGQFRVIIYMTQQVWVPPTRHQPDTA